MNGYELWFLKIIGGDGITSCMLAMYFTNHLSSNPKTSTTMQERETYGYTQQPLKLMLYLLNPHSSNSKALLLIKNTRLKAVHSSVDSLYYVY